MVHMVSLPSIHEGFPGNYIFYFFYTSFINDYLICLHNNLDLDFKDPPPLGPHSVTIRPQPISDPRSPIHNVC